MTDVTTNDPRQPNPMGGAPTTTMDVNDSIQPSNSVTTTPASQPTQAAPQPVQQPTAPTPQATAPQPQPVKPHPMSRAFDGILKNLSGGPIVVTDPVTGDRREVPQSRGTMAKSILAAALAGLMTPTQYRETPYGPVVDTGNTIAGAGAAGVAARQNREAQAQKLTDDQQARKLMTIQNNAKLVQLQAASAHSKHVMLDEQNEDAQTFLSPFKEYETIRTPDQPSAFIAQNLSDQDILKPGSPYKLTDSNVVRDGTRTVFNPQTGQMEEEPTYAVLNPKLQDIQLSPEVTDKLNQINSQWKDIHKVVGGTVRIPVNAYVSAMHDYQAVTQGENVLNTLAKEVGGKDGINLSAAVRSNKTLLPALYKLTQAVAGGNVVDNRPDNLLDTILKTPNGGDLLKLMGVTPQEADQKIQSIANDRLRATELAKTGGIGDRAPAPSAMVNAVVASAKQLPPEYQKTVLAGVNPNGMTVKELEDLKNKVLDAQKHNDEIEQKKLTQGGDPVMQSRTAKNIIEGDLARLDKITSVRGNAREQLMDAIHDEAAHRGLDTTQFSPAALENKSNTWNDYNGNKRGSTGSQIASFNAFLGHTAGAVDAMNRLKDKTFGLTGTPVVNVAMSKLGKQLTDDPDWKAYETALRPVKEEISNFLAGGYSPKAEDSALMNEIVSADETPARMTAALRQLAETADIRLAAIGERYRDTMSTTYSHLLSTDSANTLKRLNIKSRAIPLSVALPRGWQGDAASQLTDKAIAQRFRDAAGGDVNAGMELAKQNGWRF